MNQLQCHKCGTLNRADAKFCRECRTPLPSHLTMKACPNCQTPNRMDAKFCAKCGHVFSAAPSAKPFALPKLTLPIVLAAVGGVTVCALCALFILFFPSPGPKTSGATTETSTAAIALQNTPTQFATPITSAITNVPTSPSSADPLDRAKRGTVKIIVPLGGNRASAGSGSVITKRGHILTNNHLFTDDSGRPINVREVGIAFPPRDNLRGSVEVRYLAVLVRADPSNDLALVRITSQRDGSSLPADLGLGVVPIGDSDKMESGQDIFVIGYPGLGGDTLTVTRGIISGFLLDEGGYMKTDASITPGNSGGGAFNLAYELIGVASARLFSRQGDPGQIGLIRPIKLAKPLIDQAKREAGE